MYKKIKKRGSYQDPYRGLFEGLGDALFIAERDGTIVDANHAASILFAYERADLLGSNIQNLYMSLDIYKQFQEQIEREEVVRDYAVAFRTRSGHRFDSLITASVRRAPNGIPIGYQGIIRDISKNKHMERHIQKLQALAAKLLIDRERERVRLGADLHDSVGQMLVLSKVKTDLLRHADDAEREALIDELERDINEMDHLIRSMTLDSSSPVLYSMGFVPGLEALGDLIHSQYGLTVRVEAKDKWDIHNHDIRGLVYRFIRELLVNVARHANTDQATVSLGRDAAQLQVVVEDAGEGFDTAYLEHMDYSIHFGLFSIQEQLLHIAGRLMIESTPGKGTRCLLTLPRSLSEERPIRHDHEDFSGGRPHYGAPSTAHAARTRKRN